MGKLMLIKSAQFIKSAAKPSQYPQSLLPEIAFAGRSNVGKSSLINRLLNRKHLVKTSSTPGRTQLINFFTINSAFAFVDLPGYGYAKVPLSVQRQWGPMIETYLTSRKSLKGVVLLMDIRRNPKDKELALIDWFGHFNINVLLILTKSDKLSKNHQNRQRQAVAKYLGLDPQNLILFSTKSNQGRKKLWQAIQILIGS